MTIDPVMGVIEMDKNIKETAILKVKVEHTDGSSLTSTIVRFFAALCPAVPISLSTSYIYELGSTSLGFTEFQAAGWITSPSIASQCPITSYTVEEDSTGNSVSSIVAIDSSTGSATLNRDVIY